MRISRSVVLLLCVLSAIAAAQENVDLRQAFLDLNNDGVVMDISAHPDDEDGATLAYYRMQFGVTTISVLFTRGEGGQNEKGPELYEDLGVLRSAETEAAGSILGARVQFLNFMDFGYSKTATETFRVWGGAREALRRLVFAIRKYKPDIMFTNHNTIDGHGHHQAAAITAIAAFDAAADSSMFPEQLVRPGIALWQPKKLFFRAFGRFEQAADVANSIGDTCAPRGVSYLDIASMALRQHRTQGMERANLRAFTRGKSLYRIVRQNSLYERDSTSFFGGIDIWRDHSIAGLQGVHRGLLEIGPDLSRASLLQRSALAFSRLDSLERKGGNSALALRLLASWRQKLERVVSLSCGIEFDCRLRDSVVVAGQQVAGDIRLRSKDCAPGQSTFSFSVPSGWQAALAPAGPGEPGSRGFRMVVGPSPLPTLPKARAQYFSLERDQEVVCMASMTVDGNRLAIRSYVPMDVAPRLTLSLDQPVACSRPADADTGIRFGYSVRNYSPGSVDGSVALAGPAEWRARPSAYHVAVEDGEARGTIVVYPPAGVSEGEYVLRFVTDGASAEATVHIFSVATPPGLRVGVIGSYDNTIETSLQDLHVSYALLKGKELELGDLSPWRTIVIDIRAYLVREDLRKANGRLLEYVRNGGNLVVMYQREGEWKPEYAPYPFSVSRRRIADETAPVELLQPDHPLFNRPNRITPADWNGWKQERAVYLPTDVSPRYLRLVSSHDPDEPEETTGYLVATYGTGTYIYSSFVWYRQLKEHHPGAVRSFANMISLPLVAK